MSRKARNATFRNYVAAETAAPVITCCACLGADDMKHFYFAGVCRSKSVPPIDDGVGPCIDEFCEPPCTPNHTPQALTFVGACLQSPWRLAG